MTVSPLMNGSNKKSIAQSSALDNCCQSKAAAHWTADWSMNFP